MGDVKKMIDDVVEDSSSARCVLEGSEPKKASGKDYTRDELDKGRPDWYPTKTELQEFMDELVKKDTSWGKKFFALVDEGDKIFEKKKGKKLNSEEQDWIDEQEVVEFEEAAKKSVLKVFDGEF